MTRNEPARKRLDMPIADAVADKYAEGRARYGNGEWVGDVAAVEAHQDALDVLAYVGEEARQRGAHPMLSRAGLHAKLAVMALRDYLRLVGER